MEDEGLTAMELQRKLKHWGYDVPTFVFSGKEAIKKTQELDPDLVLMDIVLKGDIDGIDAAKEIIKSSKVPIIYLTAHGDEKTLERAKMTKPAAYVLKPFAESELHKIIDMAIYKHRMEKKLKKTGKLIDKGFKDSRGVIVTDHEGYVQYINDDAEDLTGWKKVEAINQKLVDVVTIKDVNTNSRIDPLKKILNGNFEKDENYSLLISRNGILKDIKYTLEPIFNDFDEFTGSTLIFNDITEIKLENEIQFLSESEKQFKSIYEHSSIPSGLFAANGKLIDVNKSFLDLVGLDLSNLKEMKLFDFLNLSTKDKNNLNAGKTIEWESKIDFNGLLSTNSYKNSSNESKYLRIILYPLHAHENSIGGYLLQTQDLTSNKILEKSLKESENEYKELINSINEIFCELDSDLNILQWNKASEDLTGISSKNALDKSLLQLLPDLEDSEILEMFSNVLNTQKSSTIEKKCLIQQKPKYLELNASPSVKGISLIIRDITDIKLDQEKIKTRKDFYRSMVDNQKDLILRCSFDGKINYANPISSQYLGTNVMGKYFSSLIPEEDKNKFENHLKSMKTDKNFENLTIRILDSNNNILDLEWSFNPLYTGDGNLSEILAVGRNVTSFVDAEKSLIQDYENLKMEYHNEINLIKEKKNSLKSKISELDQLNTSLTIEKDKLEKNIQTSLEKSNQEIKELNIHVSQLEDTNSSLREKYSSLDNLYQSQIKSHENEKKSLKNHICNLKTQEEALQKEFNELKKHSEIEIKGYETEINTLTAEIADLNNLNTELKDQYTDLEDRYDFEMEKSENSLRDLNLKINEFKDNEKFMKKQFDEVKNKFEEEIQILKKDKEMLINDLSNLKENLKLLNNKNSILEDQSKDQLKEFEMEKNDLKAQINEFKENEKSLRQKISEWELKYKTDLEELKDNETKLKNDISILNDNKNSLIMKYQELDNRLNSKVKQFNQDKKQLKYDIKNLKTENNRINEIIKEKDLFLKEMNYEFIDNLNNISSLYGIQSAYIIEELTNKFKDNQNYINSIARGHEFLFESDDLKSIDFSRYVVRLIDELYISYNVSKNVIKPNISIKNVFLDRKIALNCALIINELIINIIKHAFPDGQEGVLELIIKENDNILEIKLSDNGIGIPEKFHKMNSMGLQMVNTLVRQFDGTINLNRKSGTVYTIEFPN
ncbi:MAG: PAS domain S-box protein [Methanomicrobiales archaeon]